MKSKVVHGPWQQFKVQLRKTGSRLTDEDLAAIAPGGDDFIHAVQHRFGCERDEAATKRPRNVERDFAATMARLRRPVAATLSRIAIR